MASREEPRSPGTTHRDGAPAVLRAAADRIEAEAARATPGTWAVTGLLATRPEVVARHPDGGTVHVAEARAGTARWIALCSPALAAPLAGWLRATADTAATAAADDDLLARALELAETVLSS